MESSSNVRTLASCLSDALVPGEASDFIVGSSCAGLVAGTFGNGNLSLIALLSLLGRYATGEESDHAG